MDHRSCNRGHFLNEESRERRCGRAGSTSTGSNANFFGEQPPSSTFFNFFLLLADCYFLKSHRLVTASGSRDTGALHHIPSCSIFSEQSILLQQAARSYNEAAVLSL